MASSTLDKFILRSTSTVSLNDRFSQLLEVKLTWPGAMTSDPDRLQHRRRATIRNQQLVLLMERQPSVQRRSVKQRLGKGSIWSRLGRPAARGFRGFRGFRPFGFWGFRRRYRWGARIRLYRRIGFTRRRIGNLQRRPVSAQSGPRRILMRRDGPVCGAGALVNNTTRNQLRQTGRGRGGVGLGPRAGACGGRGRRGGHRRTEEVITKQELDKQLDEYMSMSKSRLDAQLDEYMSMSKSRLDAQLDEYMAMAGDDHWD